MRDIIMAIDKKAFDNAFQALNDGNKQAAYDFMQFLAEKQNNPVEQFYATLPEIEEPLSDSEREQLAGNTDFSSLEELERELSDNRRQ